MSTAAVEVVPGSALGSTSNALVSRLPVYDRAGRLVAYDLRFSATTPDEGPVTAALLDTFSRFSADDLFGGRPASVNPTRTLLVGDLPMPLPADVAVLKIGGDEPVDDELLAGLARLAAAGYRLALALDGGSPASADVERLLPLVQGVTVRVTGRPWEAVEAVAAPYRDLGLSLVAEDVTTRAAMERCAAAGFELFEGPWAERSGDLENLSPSQATALQLVGMLGDPDVSMSAVEQVVRRSPELAYRLLRVANSASSGAKREVGSLHEAIVMVGVARLRSWLLLLSMSGSAGGEGAMQDALTRAGTCERLARATGAAGPESAFTIGLLDGVGDALGVGAERLLQHIPALASELADTLLGSPGPLRGVLDVVVAYQHGELPPQVDAGLMADSYLSSVAWTTHTAAAVGRE